MKRLRVVCQKYGREISKSNYSKHLNACDGIKREPFKKLNKRPYCKKDLNGKNNGNHIK